ncbi:unnamed protein product [Vicia faba]|uniref:Uncharacterized protein n=1 Tax=Vicia faba TaxID=3906 RepID=A0AAV1A9M0_VICFA|nr:unnamed protein product [Vicia faba]
MTRRGEETPENFDAGVQRTKMMKVMMRLQVVERRRCRRLEKFKLDVVLWCKDRVNNLNWLFVAMLLPTTVNSGKLSATTACFRMVVEKGKRQRKLPIFCVLFLFHDELVNGWIVGLFWNKMKQGINFLRMQLKFE